MGVFFIWQQQQKQAKKTLYKNEACIKTVARREKNRIQFFLVKKIKCGKDG